MSYRKFLFDLVLIGHAKGMRAETNADPIQDKLHYTFNKGVAG